MQIYFGNEKWRGMHKGGKPRARRRGAEKILKGVYWGCQILHANVYILVFFWHRLSNFGDEKMLPPQYFYGERQIAPYRPARGIDASVNPHQLFSGLY